MELKPGYKQTEIGIIPEDWEIATLGEIGKFKNGINKNKESFGFGFPFVNLLDVFGKIKISDSLTLGLINSTKIERNEYNLKKGDVIFVRSSVKPEGVGLTSVAVENLENAVYSGFLIRFRDDNNFDLEYKVHCFYEEEFRKRLIDNSTVSANTNINQDALKKLKLPLPPLPEQKAIATALSDIDNLLEVLDRLIAKKQNLRQSAMQQLLTGKQRLPGFSGEWEEKKLGDYLIKNPDYGINAPAVPYFDNLPVYIRITDISEDGKFLPEKKVSVNHHQSSEYLLENNDIVLARTGASTGKSYLYDEKDGELVFAGFLIRVKANCKLLDPRYLKGFLETQQYWNWVIVMSMRSGQPGINGNEYAQLNIPIPPTLSEQKAIANVLSDMDTEITALKERRNKTLNIKQAMMQELLTGKTRLITPGGIN